MDQFLIVLRCLHCLIASLPDSPMGKQVIWRFIDNKMLYYAINKESIQRTKSRNCGTMWQPFQLREVYTKAVYTNDLTESSEYKECLKLLGFLSKEELLSKLESVVKIVEKSKNPEIKKIKINLDKHIKTIREASLSTASSSEIISVEEKLSRMQLKEVCVKSYFFNRPSY